MRTAESASAGSLARSSVAPDTSRNDTPSTSRIGDSGIKDTQTSNIPSGASTATTDTSARYRGDRHSDPLPSDFEETSPSAHPHSTDSSMTKSTDTTETIDTNTLTSDTRPFHDRGRLSKLQALVSESTYTSEVETLDAGCSTSTALDSSDNVSVASNTTTDRRIEEADDNTRFNVSATGCSESKPSDTGARLPKKQIRQKQSSHTNAGSSNASSSVVSGRRKPRRKGKKKARRSDVSDQPQIDQRTKASSSSACSSSPTTTQSRRRPRTDTHSTQHGRSCGRSKHTSTTAPKTKTKTKKKTKTKTYAYDDPERFTSEAYLAHRRDIDDHWAGAWAHRRATHALETDQSKRSKRKKKVSRGRRNDATHMISTRDAEP